MRCIKIRIIEVRPTPPAGGEIVWQWHVWDHLIQDFGSTKANFGIVEDHPELIDINLVFTNRLGPDQSAVYELALPVNEQGVYRFNAEGSFSPAEVLWQYTDPGVFYSDIVSGQQRLPNGNTLNDSVDP